MNNADRARSALWAIPCPADRESWWPIVGSALAEGVPEEEVLHWCEAGPNFDRAEVLPTIRSLARRPGSSRGGWLYKRAREAGWRDSVAPANGRRMPRHKPQVERKVEPGAEHPPLDFAAVWRDSEAATAEHPYIARKLGLPDGLRVYRGPLKLAGQALDGSLLVPALDHAGALRSWQAIPASDGKKLNAPGVSMAGAYFIVGGTPRDAEPLYLVEGIGAAWSAHQATGKPAAVCFGAGNVATVAALMREGFPAARLVVVADRGKEADAERIALAVGGSWAELPAEWSANADVNDLHQRDGLQAVSELLAHPHEAPAPRFRLMTADDLAALPPVRWRVPGVLPAEGIAAIYGPAGSGKTFLTLDALGAVADGREWFTHRVEPCAVVYLALEGEAGIAQRVQAYRTRHGRAPARMRFIAQPFVLLERGDVAELAEAIRAAGGGGGIVAIDTLNRAAPGADENDSRDMGRIIEGAKLLQAALGGLVLLIHHSGKDAAKGLRGHSSLMAALDAVIEVSRDGERREWRIAKSKDAADAGVHPFRLEVVELGTDADGEPITSCVVVEATPDVARKPTPGGGNQRIAWDRIGELLREAGDMRPADAPTEIPPGRPAIKLEAAADAVASRLVCDSKRRRERAMEAIRGLVSRGVLCQEDGWLWCA